MAAPKVYGFDTGFVCYHRGWHELRRDDLGPLWEHLVLNELHAHSGRQAIHYWRTKHGAEVDFVLARAARPPVAIECKWSADEFDAAGLRAFRSRYPTGPNLVVAGGRGPAVQPPVWRSGCPVRLSGRPDPRAGAAEELDADRRPGRPTPVSSSRVMR